MATEFNYKLAWTELAKPEFDSLPEVFRRLFNEVRQNMANVAQDKLVDAVLPQDIFDDLNNEDAGEVGRAIYTVHAIGYWASGAEAKQYQDGGCYWKTELLLKYYANRRFPGKREQDLLRSKYPDSAWLVHYKFMCHKTGSSYDTDEVAGLLVPHAPDWLAIESVRGVNHRVESPSGRVIRSNHMFVIGQQHFPKDGGMYIRPEQAPCADPKCCEPYEYHKHDNAVFVTLKRDVTNTELGPVLQHLVDVAKALPFQVDGFAFPNLETPERPAQPGYFKIITSTEESKSNES